MFRQQSFTGYFSLYFTLLVLPFQVFANVPVPEEITAGELIGKTPHGSTLSLPMVQTDVDINVTGPIARTVMTQTFKNPGNEWLEAVYAFPLPEKAAVDHLDLIVGERVIQGQIKEKNQAKKIYTEAKNQGKKTALVEQHRPNIFSTSVANIPPQGKIEIKLQYQQQLAWRDEGFSIRYPMAITPRYVPADQLPPSQNIEIKQEINAGWSVLPGELPNVVALNSTSNLPFLDQQEIDNENKDGDVNKGRVSIRVTLNAGFPVEGLSSQYHQISHQEVDNNTFEVSLVEKTVVPDRDFVLQWRPVAGFSPKAAFFKEKVKTQEGEEEYGLLMILPPELEQSIPQVNRETIFIIDTSGSMGGASIRQAKQALEMAIRRLKANDSFNVIEFNSSTSTLFASPRQATHINKRSALDFVGGLEAGGGTEMLPALKNALRMKSHDKSAIQQVVFITDGAVGNEEQLLSYIHAELNQRRLFTVGIGSAPNSYFMKEAAHFGRGTFSFIGSPNEVKEKMQSLFNRIEKPVLTQLSLVTDSDVEILPQRLPDLYAGEPLSVAIRVNPSNVSGLQKATITGRLGQSQWQQHLTLNNAASQKGLSVHWGREEIQHWMRASIKGLSSDEVKKEVLRVALKHHLVSKYTSLVAVDVTPLRPLDKALESKAIKSKMPAGFSPAGFSQVNQPVLMASGATNSQLFIISGLLALGMFGFVWLRNSRISGISNRV